MGSSQLCVSVRRGCECEEGVCVCVCERERVRGEDGCVRHTSPPRPQLPRKMAY